MANKLKIQLTVDDKGSVVVKQFGKTAKASLKKVDRSVDDLTGKLQLSANAWKVMGVAAAAAVAAGVYGLQKMAREFVGLSGVQEAAETRLAAVIKSTGQAAGYNVEQMKAMASGYQQLTTIGDEVVLGGQAILATFKAIRGEAFERSTMAALDMAEVMQQGLKSAIVMIGKAMNDPIANLSAMSRAGVQFTQTQKDMIKELWAAGKAMEAQDIILDELESEFGGVAKAAREIFGGGLKAAENSLGDLKEELGFIITKSEFFISLTHEAEKQFVAWGQSIKENREYLMGLAKDGVLYLADRVVFAVKVLKFFHEGWLGIKLVAAVAIETIAVSLDTLTEGLRALFLPLDLIFQGLVKIGAIEMNPFDQLEAGMADFVESNRGWGAEIIGQIEGVDQKYNTVISTLEDLRTKLATTGTTAKEAGDKIDGGADKGAEALKLTAKEAKKLAEGMQSIAEWSHRASEAYAEMMRRGPEVYAISEEQWEEIYGDSGKADQILDTFLERTQGHFADTFYDIFQGQWEGWGDLMDNMKDLFFRTLSEMAAKAAMTKFTTQISTTGAGAGGTGGISWGAAALGTVGVMAIATSLFKNYFDGLSGPGLKKEREWEEAAFQEWIDTATVALAAFSAELDTSRAALTLTPAGFELSEAEKDFKEGLGKLNTIINTAYEGFVTEWTRLNEIYPFFRVSTVQNLYEAYGQGSAVTGVNASTFTDFLSKIAGDPLKDWIEGFASEADLEWAGTKTVADLFKTLGPGGIMGNFLQTIADARVEIADLEEVFGLSIDKIITDLTAPWEEIISKGTLSDLGYELSVLDAWYAEQKKSAEELGVSLGTLDEAMGIQKNAIMEKFLGPIQDIIDSETLSDVELQIKALNKWYAEQKKIAEELGYSLDLVNQAYDLQMQGIEGTLMQGWQDIITGLTLTDSELAQLSLDTWYEKELAAAQALGLAIDKLTEAYELQQDAIEETAATIGGNEISAIEDALWDLLGLTDPTAWLQQLAQTYNWPSINFPNAQNIQEAYDWIVNMSPEQLMNTAAALGITWQQLLQDVTDAMNYFVLLDETIDDLGNTAAEQAQVLQGLVSTWSSISESLEDQIMGMQIDQAGNTGTALETIGDMISELTQGMPLTDYIGAMGLSDQEIAALVTSLQDLWGEYLTAAGETWQLPSVEYQAEYDQVLAALMELQGFAESAETELGVALDQLGVLEQIEENTQYLTSLMGFQHGTDYVPRTGIYQLHQGERVVPQGSQQGSEPVMYVTLNLKADVITTDRVDSWLADRLEKLRRSRTGKMLAHVDARTAGIAI